MRRLALILVSIVLAWPYAAHAQTSTPEPTATATAQAPLNSNMMACWTLNETSGTRTDSMNALNLTDINTVGYRSGKQSYAASFDRNNQEALDITDNASLSMGSSTFTIGGWVYVDSFQANFPYFDVVLGKLYDATGTASNTEYYIRSAGSGSSGYFRFHVSNGSSNVYVQAANISTATWYFVVAWIDNGVISLQVNNGSIASASATGSDTAHKFFMGADRYFAFFSGALDEVFIYKRLLTAAEKTYLYNAGSGRNCATLVAIVPTPTPTPSGQRQVQLSSGDWVTLERSATYGDVANTVALMALIGAIVLGLILIVSELWNRKGS